MIFIYVIKVLTTTLHNSINDKDRKIEIIDLLNNTSLESADENSRDKTNLQNKKILKRKILNTLSEENYDYEKKIPFKKRKSLYRHKYIKTDRKHDSLDNSIPNTREKVIDLSNRLDINADHTKVSMIKDIISSENENITQEQNPESTIETSIYDRNQNNFDNTKTKVQNIHTNDFISNNDVDYEQTIKEYKIEIFLTDTESKKEEIKYDIALSKISYKKIINSDMCKKLNLLNIHCKSDEEIKQIQDTNLNQFKIEESLQIKKEPFTMTESQIHEIESKPKMKSEKDNFYNTDEIENSTEFFDLNQTLNPKLEIDVQIKTENLHALNHSKNMVEIISLKTKLSSSKTKQGFGLINQPYETIEKNENLNKTINSLIGIEENTFLPNIESIQFKLNSNVPILKNDKVFLFDNVEKLFFINFNTVNKQKIRKSIEKLMYDSKYLKNPEFLQKKNFETLSMSEIKFSSSELKKIRLLVSNDLLFEEDVDQTIEIKTEIQNIYDMCTDLNKKLYEKIIDYFDIEEQIVISQYDTKLNETQIESSQNIELNEKNIDSLERIQENSKNILNRNQKGIYDNKINEEESHDEKTDFQGKDTEISKNNVTCLQPKTKEKKYKDQKENHEYNSYLKNINQIIFCKKLKKYIFSGDYFSNFFDKKLKSDYNQEIVFESIDILNYIEKYFKIKFFEDKFFEDKFFQINKLCNMLLQSKVINFDFFLKILMINNYKCQNTKEISLIELNIRLCKIIEKNKANVRLIIPQCLFYPNYKKNADKAVKKIFDIDNLVYLCFLNIFDVILSFDWNIYFHNLITSLEAYQNYYERKKRTRYMFTYLLRDKFGILYLKYVFYMRLRIEMNKIFIFLADPFLCKDVKRKYFFMMYHDNLLCFYSLKNRLFSKNAEHGIFLAKQNFFSFCPLFFATISEPINNKKYESVDNVSMNLNFKPSLNAYQEDTCFFSFCDILSLNNINFVFKFIDKIFDKPKCSNIPMFLFLKIYFEKCNHNVGDNIKNLNDEWNKLVINEFDVKTFQYLKINGKDTRKKEKKIKLRTSYLKKALNF